MANLRKMASYARARASGVGRVALRRALVPGLLLALSACAVLEQQGELAPAAPPAPAAAPRTLGAETPNDAERKRLVALYGGEYRWAPAERYLNDVLARLASVSETPGPTYRVTILNSAVVNAFALPSGDLFVTRGLLALANDTSEVAAVMAHEIAHVTARHAFLRAEQEKRAALIAQAANVIQSRQKGEEVEASSRLSFASFSRQQELDADQIGVRVIGRAGYDPYGAARFLSSLARSSALRASLIGQKGGDKPDILATHPSTPERIQHALIEARQIGAPGGGEAARGPYLDAIDGMAFGDDPAEGSIRGRKFVHPRLGFAFDAPEGFVLENSSKAVLGVADGGAQALRLDSVRVPQTTALETYLTSGWIDGLLVSSIEATQINGLPAVLANARAGEWNFRVAVIRNEGDVYRIIFAVKALNENVDHTFKTAIGTFRRIGPDEAAQTRPLRLAVITAGPGETAERIAARMAFSDRPLEHFLLINGLENTTLKPGEKYKIVVN